MVPPIERLLIWHHHSWFSALCQHGQMCIVKNPGQPSTSQVKAPTIAAAGGWSSQRKGADW